MRTVSLVEVYEEDGKQPMRLTPEGEKVARQLAMSDGDGRDALIAALLGSPRDSRRPAPMWDGPRSLDSGACYGA